MRNKSNYILFFILLANLCLLAQVPDFLFTRLSVNNKINDTKIWCFTQDKKGYMYFGGENGFYRFDSHELKQYIAEEDNLNSTSITSNKIYALAYENSKRIWLATTKGINVFNTETQTFSNYRNTGDLNVLKQLDGYFEDIALDKNQNKWIIDVNNGLGKINADNSFAGFFKVKSSHIKIDYTAVAVDDINNKVYVGTNQGLYEFKNKELIPLELNNLHINTLYCLNNELWIGHFGGLVRYDVFKNKIKHYTNQKPKSYKLSALVVSSIMAYKSGLLIGIDGGGVNYLDLNTDKITEYTAYNDAMLNSNNVTSLFVDKDQSLWVGTYMHGVNISNQSSKFATLIKNKIWGEKGRSIITGIAQDSLKNIWIVTDRDGVYQKNVNTNEVKKINLPHTNINLNDIAASDIVIINDEPWISTWSEGIVRIGKNKIYNYTNTSKDIKLINNNIKTLFYDKSTNDLWLGYFGHGLTRINLKTFMSQNFTFKDFKQTQNSISNNWVQNIAKDPNGNIWILTANGFTIYNPSNKSLSNHYLKYTNSDSSRLNFISDVLFAKNNFAFLATNYGVVRLDLKNNFQLSVYKQNSDFNEQSIKKLQVDTLGNIWATSRSVLSKISGKNYEQITWFNVSVGYENYAFTDCSFLNKEKNTLLIGTSNGLVQVNPDQESRNKNISNILITDFSVYTEGHKERMNAQLKIDKLNEFENIKLASNYNDISIKYSLLNFINPEYNQYRFKLEGLETNWKFTNTPEQVNYYNLQPGNYRFIVYGCNNDGIWNDIPASVSFEILPPWYESWWFYVFLIVLILILIYTYAKSQLAVFKIQKQKLEHIVNSRTEQLKSANVNLETMLYRVSHDLKEPVKSTLGLVNLGKMEFAKDQKFQVFLEHLSNSANKLNKLLSELTLLSNTSFISLSQQIDFKQIIHEIVLEFDYKTKNESFDVTLNIEDQIFFYSDKRVVYTLLFNLIDNSFIFRDKDKFVCFVHISVSKQQDKLIILLNDNGIGIDNNDLSKIFEMFYRGNLNSKGSGMGLFVVKSLVSKLGGKISVSSIKGVGTEFVIELPFKN